MSGPKRERLDSLLQSRGLAETRSKARELILEGKVFVGGIRAEKAATQVSRDASLEVRDEGKKWVSRGAKKLLKGLDVFEISPEGLVCVDIGASTGGFTQVLLEGGAKKVYSVDVGYGQLAWTLRQDDRVVVMERTNGRDLSPGSFPAVPDLAVADASFISLKLLIPPLCSFLSPEGRAILLVKPQFEAGRERVGKGGVVRASETHREILEEILDFCRTQDRFHPAGLSFSPIRGPMGNIEFLLHCERNPDLVRAVDPEKTVEEAHIFFGRKDS